MLSKSDFEQIMQIQLRIIDQKIFQLKNRIGAMTGLVNAEIANQVNFLDEQEGKLKEKLAEFHDTKVESFQDFKTWFESELVNLSKVYNYTAKKLNIF
jgi:hypothetical protein